MYHHIKKLMYTVRVDRPDPRFGNMLLEQFGGANGELAAAMQYSRRAARRTSIRVRRTDDYRSSSYMKHRALESMEKPPFAVALTAALVDKFSMNRPARAITAISILVAIGTRARSGNSSSPGRWKRTASRQARARRCMSKARGSKTRNRSSLLITLLHGEKQLLKALPKMGRQRAPSSWPGYSKTI